MTLPTVLIVISTVTFLALERLAPGRELPKSRGWYARALSVNLAQLVITVATGSLWMELSGDDPLLDLAAWDNSLAEGFVAWFVGTFVFYWWHRLRHRNGLWRVFHQIHHSPSRIEVLTSFYKHPVEILANSALTAVILFPVLGCSVLAGAWYNFFAATGEYVYHANIRTPAWLRYLIQTPELHSIHHQHDVHSYNFADLPLWDRLFGTYRDTVVFTQRCGFPRGCEQKLGAMLLFRDVYDEGDETGK